MDNKHVETVLPIADTVPFNPWSRKMFLEELVHPSSHCFLLSRKSDDHQDVPLGFICFRNVGEESELLNVAIAPSHRGRGFGKKLMEFYIDFCRHSGVKKYYLEVNPENVSAVRLYQSFGYQPTGKRKKFYQGKYDALLMER